MWLVYSFIIVTSFTLDSCQFSCPDDEFECDITQTCIPGRWKCDGESDCTDGKDEKGCSTKVVNCPSDYYKCKSGRCIKNAWLCDKQADCPDADDETPHHNCSDKKQTCAKTDFQCINGDCIEGSFKCDNEKDCEDGSDELGCPVAACSVDEIKCDDGTSCVAKTSICDGRIDCVDGSDEKNCSSCTGTHYQCTNKECIPMAWRCDADVDCTDKSDEEGCSQSSPVVKPCSVDQFQCTDDYSCISKHWKCDGETDCVDNSDEQGCPAFIICSTSQFTCNTGRCVPMIARCNGRYECPDGSDELNCAAATTPSPCEGMFFCSKSSACIDDSKVCDNKKDCPDGEDESLSCNINECSDHNGHCHHGCIDLKIGYKCSCGNGYTLSNDSRACKDSNECEVYGTCSQTCVNTKGSYKCGCVDGYVHGFVHNTCKAKGPSHYLIFGDGHSICNTTTAGNQHNVMVTNLKAPMAIDYHIHAGHIYWSDVIEEKIQRASLYGGDQTETIVENVEHANGIAVDWIGGNIYWTDESNQKIEVSRLDGKHRLTLFHVTNGSPRAIAIDPFKRFLFWTDWNSIRPKLERASMDGNSVSRLVIIDKDIVWPNSIALDPILERVYFSDSKLKKIETCKYDGSSRTTILSTSLQHPFSLNVFEDHLYYSDHKLGTIYSVNKRTGFVHDEVLEKLDRLTAISVVHPLRQKKVDSVCTKNNGGCSHLCLLSTNVRKYSCRCPEGMHQHSDGKSCKRIVVIPTKKPGSEEGTPTLKTDKCADHNGGCSHYCKESAVQVTCYCPKMMSLDKDQKTCVRNPATTMKPGSMNHDNLSTTKSTNKGPMIAGITVALLFMVLCVCVVVLYLRKRTRFRDRTILFYKDNSRVPLQNDFDDEQLKTPEEIGSRSRVQFA